MGTVQELWRLFQETSIIRLSEWSALILCLWAWAYLVWVGVKGK